MKRFITIFKGSGVTMVTGLLFSTLASAKSRLGRQNTQACQFCLSENHYPTTKQIRKSTYGRLFFLFSVAAMTSCGYDFFKDTPYTLTTTAMPENGGVIIPSAEKFEDIEHITLRAEPARGWRFVEWSGDVEGDKNPVEILVDSSLHITAHFSFLHDTVTAVVEVTNPVTGRVWMDRNLGASRAAISSTDSLAYGDLYQWGRGADGHQKRNSPTTSTLSRFDQPGHGRYIIVSDKLRDWRSPQNDILWQGVNGINNPCPVGYRLPTDTEWEAEINSWSSYNAAGAFASPLKLPLGGFRTFNDGSLAAVGAGGFYWSISVSETSARSLTLGSKVAIMVSYNRARGYAVRCIKNHSSYIPGYTLSTMVSPEQGGTIRPSEGEFEEGEKVTLHAEPAEGWRFVEWSGAVEGDNSSVEMTIDENKNVTASFARIRSSLSLNVSPEGRGWVTGSGEYGQGAVVSITAIPIYGYDFVKWTGDTEHVMDVNAASTTLNMPGKNMTLMANFDFFDYIGTETEVVEVTNPVTGRVWMDRNLGASRVATFSTDNQAYGTLFQWGRGVDGHQIPNTAITSSLSHTDQPGHGHFILPPDSPFDWLRSQNDNLWQGVNGINNPCPVGFRLPTETEWEAERQSWESNDVAGAFASPLKLPVAGFRSNSNGFVFAAGSSGNYWSSSVSGTFARSLYFDKSDAGIYSYRRAFGYTVRCIRE